jgi:hypothetical protein
MTDQTAEVARLMKVTEAVVEELARQGVLEIVADYGFDPTEMAKAVIKAADGDVARSRGRKHEPPKGVGSFSRPGGLVPRMGERGRVGVTSPHIAMFGSIITNVSNCVTTSSVSSRVTFMWCS